MHVIPLQSPAMKVRERQRKMLRLHIVCACCALFTVFYIVYGIGTVFSPLY